MIRDVAISSEDCLLAHVGYAENLGSAVPRTLAHQLAWATVRAAAAILPGTVVGITDGKLVTRSEPRLTWRIARAFFPALGVALVWARRYEKALRDIDRNSRRPY